MANTQTVTSLGSKIQCHTHPHSSNTPPQIAAHMHRHRHRHRHRQRHTHCDTHSRRQNASWHQALAVKEGPGRTSPSLSRIQCPLRATRYGLLPWTETMHCREGTSSTSAQGGLTCMSRMQVKWSVVCVRVAVCVHVCGCETTAIAYLSLRNSTPKSGLRLHRR